MEHALARHDAVVFRSTICVRTRLCRLHWNTPGISEPRSGARIKPRASAPGRNAGRKLRRSERRAPRRLASLEKRLMTVPVSGAAQRPNLNSPARKCRESDVEELSPLQRTAPHQIASHSKIGRRLVAPLLSLLLSFILAPLRGCEMPGVAKKPKTANHPRKPVAQPNAEF